MTAPAAGGGGGGAGAIASIAIQEGLGFLGSRYAAKKAEALNREQRAWNAAEAQKQRDWQQYMSNTSYQRAATDLQSAGLNRILALGGGSSTPSGAVGQGVDLGSSAKFYGDVGKNAKLLENRLLSANIQNALQGARTGESVERLNRELAATEKTKQVFNKMSSVRQMAEALLAGDKRSLYAGPKMVDKAIGVGEGFLNWGADQYVGPGLYNFGSHLEHRAGQARDFWQNRNTITNELVNDIRKSIQEKLRGLANPRSQDVQRNKARTRNRRRPGS